MSEVINLPVGDPADDEIVINDLTVEKGDEFSDLNFGDLSINADDEYIVDEAKLIMIVYKRRINYLIYYYCSFMKHNILFYFDGGMYYFERGYENEKVKSKSVK